MIGTPLLRHTISTDAARASLTVDGLTRSPYQVSPHLLGKFCEHLGSNIYHGMEAQILVNPTFARWVFSAGDDGIDGGLKPEYDREKMAGHVHRFSRHQGYLEPNTLFEDFVDGGTFGWMRVGAKESVVLSPDVGPHGGRAQRVEVATDGKSCGLVQWTYLPLPRTRRYEYRAVARATSSVVATLTLDQGHRRDRQGLASVELPLTDEWTTFTGVLELPADSLRDENDEASLYWVRFTVSETANIVIDRLLLYPDDHIDHADPDVIHFLRESKLPLLRWPGGNFVSGYDWRDGIGPVDARPTRPNPAWGGLEYNLFGTAEFVAFCRAVGCEPMICVNAGNGAPADAAAWVEYCNGSAETPGGRLRTEHGHPEPFGITFWEVGNESFGKWQVQWTTPGGYADRYKQFSNSMQTADPQIKLLACGFPWWPDDAWDRRLIADLGPELRCLTDHVLTGGPVTHHTRPAELYHAFLGQAMDIGRRYRAVAARMQDAGIAEPSLAITELQLFAHFQNPASEEKPAADALSQATMPTPATISEALYFATILHECIRLEGLVEMITHSATVNHGGGLRKTRERVWANPVHHAHALAAPLAGGTPVAVRLDCAAFSTRQAFQGMPPLTDVPVIDAVAVLSANESTLTLMLAHRSADTGPITLSVDLSGFPGTPEAELVTLAGTAMWDQNTPEEPHRIVPHPSTLPLTNGRAEITLPPFSLTRLTLIRDL